MIVVRDTETLKGKRLVATIGFFDGVHLGHRFLIHELKQVAEAAGLPSAVITFPEHPRAVLHADYQPKLLNSFEEKLKHLASTGIDYCIVLDFTLELSRLTAKEFITTVLADRLHVDTLLIGYDHRFGHNREDGFEQYNRKQHHQAALLANISQIPVFDAHINDVGHHKGNQQLKAGFQHFEQRGKDGFFLVSFQKPQHVPHKRTNLFVISNYMPKATPHNSRLAA